MEQHALKPVPRSRIAGNGTLDPAGSHFPIRRIIRQYLTFHLLLAREIIGSMKRLPNALATGISLLAAMLASIGAGLLVAFGVVVTWFNNTRGDGYAVLVITTISMGIFVSLVTFTFLVSFHHVPSGTTVPFAASAWIVWAAYLTWANCRESYITWDNWLWIIRTQSDFRAYYLNWMIRGWLAIGVGGVLGLFVSRVLLKRASRKRAG
jgi:hypothetical protein